MRLKLSLYVLVFAGIALLLASGVAEGQRPASPQTDEQSSARQGRLAPPASLKCSRNETTSFTGRVLSYQRKRGSVFIRVRTDEETTESFTIRFPKTSDASKIFLLNGASFGQSDWARVERSRGVLRPNMRATIWACRDSNDNFHAEVIDWRPDGDGSRYVL